MKLINSYIFRSICMMMVGLLLILNPNTPVILIQVIAALFAVSGLFSLINYVISHFSKKALVRPTFPVAGVGSLLFGLVLGLYPESFLHFLMYLLGGLILLMGISQLFSVFSYRNVAPLRWTVFVIPVLIILVGLFVLFHYREAANLPFTILGACCIFNGISDLFYGLRLRHYERQSREFSKYEDVTFTIEGMDTEDKPTMEEADAEEV